MDFAATQFFNLKPFWFCDVIFYYKVKSRIPAPYFTLPNKEIFEDFSNDFNEK